jgi:hypothetical protein
MNVIPLVLCCVALQNPAADPPALDVRPQVGKGLAYLIRHQAADGSWAGTAGQFPTSITSLAGLALLMEGTTPSEGKYAPQLRKAIDWMVAQARDSGMILAPNVSEQSRYMLSHGLATMFLACAYAAEEDPARRDKLAKVLAKAVAFAASAQTSRGGWGYVTAAEGNDFHEGHATVLVLQGLRAARSAGIAVPKAVLDGATKYFEDSTNPRGGIIYSLLSGANAAGRPVISAGAAALSLHGETRSPKVAGWVKFAAEDLNSDLTRRNDSFALLQHFYFSRLAYTLGTDGHRKLDPAAKDTELIRWPAYRKVLYGSMKTIQQEDGSWADRDIGPAFGTSLALIILQLENEAVPFFRR